MRTHITHARLLSLPARRSPAAITLSRCPGLALVRVSVRRQVFILFYNKQVLLCFGGRRFKA